MPILREQWGCAPPHYLGFGPSLSPSSSNKLVAGEAGRKRGELWYVCVHYIHEGAMSTFRMVHLYTHSYHSHVNMVSAAEEEGRWMEGRGSRDLDKRAGPQGCQNVMQAAGICVDV